MAEVSVGFGVEFFAPKRRFMVAVEEDCCLGESLRGGARCMMGGREQKVCRIEARLPCEVDVCEITFSTCCTVHCRDVSR